MSGSHTIGCGFPGFRSFDSGFELLKLEAPLQTQKQQLNRLMGRDPDTPFMAQQNIERGDDPRMAADAVWNALTAKSPWLRYPVGKGIALSRMRRFVPASLFDKSFRKQFQLD